MGCIQIVGYSDAYTTGNEGGREEREERMSSHFILNVGGLP